MHHWLLPAASHSALERCGATQPCGISWPTDPTVTMAICAVLCYDGLCTLFTSSSVQMSSTPARLLQLPTFDWLVDRGSQCLSMKNYSVELPTINHQGVGSPSFKHHGIMVRIERSKTCELTAATQTPHIRSDPSSIPIVYGCKCRFHRHLPCKGDV